MKKLLFLYPIEEYMQSSWKYRPEIYDLLNETINERYREKGYQIIFVTFKSKPVFGVNVCDNDRVIECDITFKEHTTPIGKDETGKDIYIYPSNEHMKQLLGEFEELVICGFHAQDCVMRVAKYFYSINNKSTIDEELTDFLGNLSERFYFNKETYNLANKLMYDKAEDMLMHGKEFLTKFTYYKERYSEPYLHIEKFKSDFTLEECMAKMQKLQEKERQK